MSWVDRALFTVLAGLLLYIAVSVSTPAIVDATKKITPHIERWDSAYELGKYVGGRASHKKNSN